MPARQVVAARAADLDRHPAHVLLAIGRGRRVRESDPGAIAARLLKQSDLEFVGETGDDGELRFDTARCPSLVEPAEGADSGDEPRWPLSGTRSSRP
jgi:hypothetical protein